MIWTSSTILTAISDAYHIDCVREADLVEKTGLTETQVERACLKLRQHGLLEKCGQGCHTITDAGRVAMAEGKQITSGAKGKRQAPRVNKNSLRIKVWRAMRIRSKFSIPELTMLVAQGGEKDIASNIGKYIRALQKAGYLVEMGKREKGSAITSNGHKRYWLLPERNTGMHAPVWRVSANTVYDPNTELEHALCG